jgi:alpha-tubulin suppressor-like RCC1 family protein
MLMICDGMVYSAGQGKNGALGHGDSDDRKAPRYTHSFVIHSHCHVRRINNHFIHLYTYIYIYGIQWINID